MTRRLPPFGSTRVPGPTRGPASHGLAPGPAGLPGLPGLPGPRGIGAALALGVALWAAVYLGDSLVPPAPGEPRVGRWLRKLAEHPLRGSLALGLFLLAGGLPGRLGGAPRPSRGTGDRPEVEPGPKSG